MFAFKTIIWGTIFSFIALLIGPWLALQFDSSFPPLDLGIFRYLGILFLAGGVPLAIYCAAILFLPVRNKPRPYDSADAFIIAGPYRYVRNPFMLGILITLIGETLLLSRVAMIAYTLIFAWCLHFWVIFFEEPALTERFQDEYRDYKRSVPRWLPRFSRY
jgi:protein-S-isoprenylcysteine O-methyltransferase Ste14